MKRLIAALLALAATPAPAAIVLDGKLDEAEWAAAQRFGDFRTTEPFTQAQPELATTVLVHSDESGLYFGFICDQPPGVERVRTRGQRDQFIAGDRVNVMLDFDGSGAVGYEFTAYLGGQKQDATISRQTRYNYDWDGDWDYAASEDEGRWYIEYRIPWTVAPMGATTDGKLRLGAFFSRAVVKTGKRYSFPAHAFTRATFVSDLHEIDVTAHAQAQLDVFPYVAGNHDVLSEESDARAGLDLFWKPNAQHQLTATVNPDFGQVESDELVVNFSAIPTFFPDKRPFFTENQGLFTTDINVLYTRRIGAAPDAGPEGASDILGALKYTGRSGDLAYGLIGAWEDDSSLAEGRDFYVGRARYQLSDALTVGWIGSHVERPTLGRRADAHALDFAWTIAPGVSLSGQGVHTDVDHDAPSFFDPAGDGAIGRFLLGYAPGGRLESTTSFISKNQTYNINDAGFMSRPSEHLISNSSTWFWREFAPDSAVQQATINSRLLLRANDSGDTLPTDFALYSELLRRDQHLFGLEFDVFDAGGVDDVLTRGNGPVKKPVRQQLYPYYVSPQDGSFRYVIVAGFGNGYFTDTGYWHARFAPGWYPADDFSLTASAGFTQAPDELIWQGGTLVGAYDYDEQSVAINTNWFPWPRHELRGKFQWIAASGDAVAGYRPSAAGHLAEVPDPIADFSFTTTAFQLRYRYELAPLSELFVVYSHGGFDALGEPEGGMGSSLRRGLAEETDSQFLLKLRYRFRIQ